MERRGRKSKEQRAAIEAAQTAQAAAVEVFTEYRIPPPPNLSAAAVKIWLDTVNSFPASALSEAHLAMLSAYCEHCATAEMLSAKINAFLPQWLDEDGGLDHYDKLLKMRERETRSASSLATRLRLTPQASIDPKTHGRQKSNMTSAAKPWLYLDAKGD